MEKHDIKISLSIYLQGSVVLRDDKGMSLKDSNNNLITKQAVLHKLITNDCYMQFVGGSAPQFIKHTPNEFKWGKLNRREKLELYLQNLCEHYKGTHYTYHIFE